MFVTVHGWNISPTPGKYWGNISVYYIIFRYRKLGDPLLCNKGMENIYIFFNILFCQLLYFNVLTGLWRLVFFSTSIPINIHLLSGLITVDGWSRTWNYIWLVMKNMIIMKIFHSLKSASGNKTTVMNYELHVAQWLRSRTSEGNLWGITGSSPTASYPDWGFSSVLAYQANSVHY